MPEFHVTTRIQRLRVCFAHTLHFWEHKPCHYVRSTEKDNMTPLFMGESEFWSIIYFQCTLSISQNDIRLHTSSFVPPSPVNGSTQDRKILLEWPVYLFQTSTEPWNGQDPEERSSWFLIWYNFSPRPLLGAQHTAL